MTEPREKGWVSMGLPEPGPVRGMRGVVGLLLLLLLLLDDLVACCCGLMMGSIVFFMMSDVMVKFKAITRSQAKSQVTKRHSKKSLGGTGLNEFQRKNNFDGTFCRARGGDTMTADPFPNLASCCHKQTNTCQHYHLHTNLNQ